MKLAYLVHDLGDAAVRRRVALFQAAGLTVAIGGFQRDSGAPSPIGGVVPVSFGRTRDGALAQRVAAVLRHAALPGAVRALVADAEVIVARNLETLVLARRAARPGQRIVYECLDIHRLLLGEGAASRMLHAIERWALDGVVLVVVSAPAFRDRYFVDRIGYRGEVMLVENLVPRLDDAPVRVVDPPPGPPWVIGWFGMLRCRRSFDLLKAVAAAGNGRVEVVIAGRPSPGVFADLPGEAEAAPHVRYLGGYTADDLPDLFGRIHCIWAIDYFEEGLNSAWLLPNRLYEGVAHGAVPIALRSVATGAWLEEHGVGLLLDDPAAELPPLLDALTPAAYAALHRAVAGVPANAVTMDQAQARAIAAAITGAA